MANLSQLALNGTTYDLQAKDYTSSGGIATALGNKLGKSDKAASATTADTATKATTAQNYDSSTGNIKSTFDTVNNTLKTLSDGKQDKGDYAKKTADDLNTMINKLSTGASDPHDEDYYVAQYAGGGTSTTSYHRRPVSALWGYIKDKISSVLGLTAAKYDGAARYIYENNPSFPNEKIGIFWRGDDVTKGNIDGLPVWTMSSNFKGDSTRAGIRCATGDALLDFLWNKPKNTSPNIKAELRKNGIAAAVSDYGDGVTNILIGWNGSSVSEVRGFPCYSGWDETNKTINIKDVSGYNYLYALNLFAGVFNWYVASTASNRASITYANLFCNYGIYKDRLKGFWKSKKVILTISGTIQVQWYKNELAEHYLLTIKAGGVSIGAFYYNYVDQVTIIPIRVRSGVITLPSNVDSTSLAIEVSFPSGSNFLRQVDLDVKTTIVV